MRFSGPMELPLWGSVLLMNTDRVIAVYIEGFQPAAGRRFFNIGSRGLADQSRVPIVVYKAGRTREGQMATQSHTASIAGEYAVAKAADNLNNLVLTEEEWIQ